jgi:hypothetical protein
MGKLPALFIILIAQFCGSMALHANISAGDSRCLYRIHTNTTNFAAIFNDSVMTENSDHPLATLRYWNTNNMVSGQQVIVFPLNQNIPLSSSPVNSFVLATNVELMGLSNPDATHITFAASTIIGFPSATFQSGDQVSGMWWELTNQTSIFEIDGADGDMTTNVFSPVEITNCHFTGVNDVFVAENFYNTPINFEIRSCNIDSDWDVFAMFDTEYFGFNTNAVIKITDTSIKINGFGSIGNGHNEAHVFNVGCFPSLYMSNVRIEAIGGLVGSAGGVGLFLPSTLDATYPVVPGAFLYLNNVSIDMWGTNLISPLTLVTNFMNVSSNIFVSNLSWGSNGTWFRYSTPVKSRFHPTSLTQNRQRIGSGRIMVTNKDVDSNDLAASDAAKDFIVSGRKSLNSPPLPVEMTNTSALVLLHETHDANSLNILARSKVSTTAPGNQHEQEINLHSQPQIVSEANLSIRTYAGISITGVVGRTYEIQSSSDLNNWNKVTTVRLTSSPYLWLDPNPVSGNTFYRALLFP